MRVSRGIDEPMELPHMRTIHKILMITSLLLPFAASAQSITDIKNMSPDDRRTYLQSMSDDERSTMMEKWRAEFDSLPEEEQQALRAERADQRGTREGKRDREAMRQRWDSMSDEERATAKERYQARSAERRQRLESMSDEERAAAREKRGERKGSKGQRQHRDAAEQPES